MLQAGAVKPGARERKHVERHVEAEPAFDRRSEQFQHAPGAGAEIEQRAQLSARERAGDGCFDGLVGNMQLANAIPLGRMPAEVSLRGSRPRGAHRGEALAIAQQHGVRRVEPPDEIARQLGRRVALAQPKEGPGTLAEPLDQTCLRQEP